MKFYTIKLPKFLGGFVRAILGIPLRKGNRKAPNGCFFVLSKSIKEPRWLSLLISWEMKE